MQVCVLVLFNDEKLLPINSSFYNFEINEMEYKISASEGREKF